MFATATICGYTGYEPTQLRTKSGKVVAKISLFVNQPNKVLEDRIGFIVHAYVHGAQAVNALEIIKTGQKITATGRLGFREYTDEKTGEIKHETRLDFAQILDYGQTSNKEEINTKAYEEPKANKIRPKKEAENSVSA